LPGQRKLLGHFLEASTKEITSTLQVSIFNGELKREKTEHSFVRVTTQNRKVTHKEINQKNEERNAQTNKDVKLRLFFSWNVFLCKTL